MAIIFMEKSECQCRLCGRQMRQDEQFCGKRMWHHWEPTCRHEVFFTCPDCSWRGDDRVCCSVCRSEIFYT